MPFKITMRSIPLPPSQVLRSVDRRVERGVVVIATETPIDRYDEKHGLYREVLLMSGVRFRGGRNQIPIVDSHDDSTVRNILGSVRNIVIDRANGELFGVESYSSTIEAKDTATKIAEGHITDYSITAMPLDGIWIDRGQTYTTERGAVIEGPAHIITAWEPHNASVCATGADVNSVVRRSYTDLNRKDRSMDEAIMAQLSSLGVPEGMTDANQIIAFLAGKLQGKPAEMETPEAPEMVESMEEEVPVVPTEEVQKMDEAVKEEVARALAADRKRRAEIVADCKLAKLERLFADKLCESGVSADEARKAILKESSTRTITRSASSQDFVFNGDTDQEGISGESFTVTRSSEDKFYDAARDGLILRSLQATGKNGAAKNFKAAEGASEFKNLGLMRLAEQFLLRRGINTSRMNAPDIAKLAMSSPSALQRNRIERADFSAYHTTGSFANLMLDASNKTLLNAYEEAPYTWNLWARQGASVPDFKAIHRVRFSESPNLEIVPERNDYPEKTMSDFRESYSVTKYGASFSVSWETIVNDDLDALSRIPALHGNAARREQNRAVYAVLTANAALSDGGALFNTTAVTTAGGHANQSSSAGVIAAGTMNAAYVSMLTQRGLNTSVILNIQPRFLIVPAAISHTALQFANSIADPGAGGSAAGNSNTLNIYGPQGMRNLQVIVEPQLDASSASIWYLAADSSQIDTVELTFLQGEESPVLESEWNIKNDTWLYKVRQTFAAKAIDFRGLYRNA